MTKGDDVKKGKGPKKTGKLKLKGDMHSGMGGVGHSKKFGNRKKM